jgi:hypothetical protein
MIDNARKNDSEMAFARDHKKLLKAFGGTTLKGLDAEDKFYKRGSGFIHGGLKETAVYAVVNNPKVAAHLFRTLRLELKNSTLRSLQFCLQFHMRLMQAATKGERYGRSPVDDVMTRTTSLLAIAKQYHSEIATLAARRPS